MKKQILLLSTLFVITFSLYCCSDSKKTETVKSDEEIEMPDPDLNPEPEDTTAKPAPVKPMTHEDSVIKRDLVILDLDSGYHKGVLNNAQKMAICAVAEPTFKMPTDSLILEVMQEDDSWNGEYDDNGERVRTYSVSSRKVQTWKYFGQSIMANGLYGLRYNSDTNNIDSETCTRFIWVFGDFNEPLSNAFHSQVYRKNATEKSIKTLLKDKTYHTKVYQWLKPSFILAWKSFSTSLKNTYKGLFAYVRTFNYADEKKYYLKLKGEGKLWDFIYNEPNGSPNACRKAKAWVFRRIYFDGWDFAYVLKWMKTIETEIMATPPATKS